MELDAMPEVLTAKNIAEHLQISKRKVYELFIMPVANGGIPSFAVGGNKRVYKTAYIKWLDERVSK